MNELERLHKISFGNYEYLKKMNIVDASIVKKYLKQKKLMIIL